MAVCAAPPWFWPENRYVAAPTLCRAALVRSFVVGWSRQSNGPCGYADHSATPWLVVTFQPAEVVVPPSRPPLTCEYTYIGANGAPTWPWCLEYQPMIVYASLHAT